MWLSWVTLNSIWSPTPCNSIQILLHLLIKPEISFKSLVYCKKSYFVEISTASSSEMDVCLFLLFTFMFPDHHFTRIYKRALILRFCLGKIDSLINENVNEIETKKDFISVLKYCYPHPYFLSIYHTLTHFFSYSWLKIFRTWKKNHFQALTFRSFAVQFTY